MRPHDKSGIAAGPGATAVRAGAVAPNAGRQVTERARWFRSPWPRHRQSGSDHGGIGREPRIDTGAVARHACPRRSPRVIEG